MKKIISLAAAVLAASLVSAQTSNTNISTSGAFGTDVDDYMGVTSWSGVEPQNLFAFFGIESSFHAYTLGAAHQFGNVLYWGTYFSGDFGTKATDVDYDTDGKQDGSTTTRTNPVMFTFDNLFGFGKIGAKLGFKFYNNGSSSTEYQKSSKTAFELGGHFGTKLDVAGLGLSPHASFVYGYNFTENADGSFQNTYTVTKGIKDNDGLLIKKGDKSSVPGTFDIVLGSGIDFAQKGPIAHSAGLDLALSFDTVSDAIVNGTKYKVKNSDVTLAISPSYSAKFEPNEKFGLKVMAGLPLAWEFTDDHAATATKETTFTVNPKLGMGVYYIPKEKMQLNAGVDFALPYAVSSSQTYGGKKTDATSEVRDSDIDGDSLADNCQVSFNTGFKYDINQNFSLDFNWQILQTLFGTDFESEGGSGSLLSTLDDILFTKLRFIVSVKF